MTFENPMLIIQTKLNRPRAPGDLVPRSKLIDRLNQGRQRPLTIVTAPAGYGKSTLLSSWLETLSDPDAESDRREIAALGFNETGKLPDQCLTRAGC